MGQMVVVFLLLLPLAEAAGMCKDSQPCGIQCIPWDAPCRVAERPGSEDPGWNIPWELLNLQLARTIVFVGVYGGLVVIARRKSIGPREV